MFYREAWTDSRLNYDKAMFRNKTEIALHESYTNMIWHPGKLRSLSLLIILQF